MDHPTRSKTKSAVGNRAYMNENCLLTVRSPVKYLSDTHVQQYHGTAQHAHYPSSPKTIV